MICRVTGAFPFCPMFENMDLIDCSPRHKDTMIWNETWSDDLETIWIHQNENSCHIKPLGDKYVRQSSPGMDLLH